MWVPAAVLAGVAALGMAGSLDPSFGGDGTVLTDVGEPYAAAAVATGPGGAIAVVATDGEDVTLVRYGADGRLEGIVETDLDKAGDVAIQPDGKILVAGGKNGDFAVVRYAADGTLDTTFGDGGAVVTDLGGEELVRRLLPRRDGRIVAAGQTTRGIALVRYLRNGRRDAAVVTNVAADEGPFAAAAGPDGSVVVALRRIVGPPQASVFVLARYRPNGTLDRAFGRRGFRTLGPRVGWVGAFDVAVQRDLKVLLASRGRARDVSGFALVRLRRDGSLDPSFGTGGTVVSAFGYGARRIALDSRGRIVAAGETRNLSDFTVARYRPNGRIDSSFGEGGSVVTDFGSRDTPFALALQSDGRILAAGASGPVLYGDLALARYLAAG